jgi:phosphate starvation-inducible protein PhoH
MAKSKVTQKKVTLSELNNHNVSNKRQALKDLKMLNFDDIQFKNPAQRRFYKTISTKDITFGIGPAGCGKTYLSVHKALKELGDKDSTIDGIVIVKPLVEAAGEKIGFLPGDVEEKTLPFMMSFYYNMEQIIGKQRLQVLKDSNTIQVIPMAYMRGLAQFKEKDIVRHSLVRRLLKRYKDSFQIIDEISAEKTISMWIHEQGLDSINDGSMNTDDTFYQLKK